MGEIGQPRHEVLYELRQWEIIATIRGYRKRERPVWESARLHASLIMTAIGCKIQSLQELITFPWEKALDDITEEQKKELLELIQKENEKK